MASITDADDSLYSDNPAFQPRRLRVVCVGAGFSGLTLAYKIQHDPTFSFIDLTIYEANEDIGGTWYTNVYPGVACDVCPSLKSRFLVPGLTSCKIPAHVYAFPFAPNPNWSSYYVTGAEIQKYILDTASKFGLRKNISLRSKVTESTWDEQDCRWRLRIERDGEDVSDVADILINATGFLSRWKWPDIPDLHSFRGQLVHSAAWDSSTSCSGKRIALIGNGSSGIQILPQIAGTATHISNFIRSPTWVSTPLASDQSRGGKNFTYAESEKQEFREDPEKHKAYRQSIEHLMNTRFPSVLQGSKMSEHAREVLDRLMRERLGHDEKLMANIIPDFPVSCRRITPGEGYLEALTAPHVRTEFKNIARVSEIGIITTDEEEHQFDIIICATGFDVSFCPSWPVTGKDGHSLLDLWRESPSSYFGLCAPKMPNFFIFNGPNSPVSQGSLLTVIDFASDYILRWCWKIATQDVKYLSPSSHWIRSLT